MLREAWDMARDSVTAFINDGALSRGAAIAFYAVTAVGPVLLIVVAVAGLVYGREAAQGELIAQIQGTVGEQSASFLQTAIQGSAGHRSGVIATVIGAVTLIVTASGVFGEMQTALNTIWKVQPRGGTAWLLIRARLVSLILVASLGLVLLLSVVIAAAISAVQPQVDRWLPFASLVIQAVNFLVSLGLLALVIGAIYRVLPDCDLEWRDVIVGAVVTALLITLGKTAIGIYIGRSGISSSYGAAGSVIVLLLWVYYCSEIFLLGAEFTKIYAERHGTRRGTICGSGRA